MNGVILSCCQCGKQATVNSPDVLPFDWCDASDWLSPFEYEEGDVLCDECNSTYAMEE